VDWGERSSPLVSVLSRREREGGTYNRIKVSRATSPAIMTEKWRGRDLEKKRGKKK